MRLLAFTLALCASLLTAIAANFPSVTVKSNLYAGAVVATNSLVIGSSTNGGWQSLGTATDINGHTIYGFNSINFLANNGAAIAVNNLTNFDNGVDPNHFSTVISLGYPGVDVMEVGKSSAAQYFNGDHIAYQATLTNNWQLYMEGYFVGWGAAIDNSFDLFLRGDETMQHATVTDFCSDFYFDGFDGGNGSIWDATTLVFGYGDSPWRGAKVTNSFDLYGFGTNPGKNSVINNSIDITAISGLEGSTLTNTKHLVTIGRTAGNSISGAYTNVVLIGDGATIGSTGQNQVNFGPGMTVSVPGTLSAGASVYPITASSWSSTTSIDVASGNNNYRTLTLGGDTTFTSANRAAGHWATVIITGAATNCNLTLPSWKFQNQAAPTVLAASKTATITVLFVDGTDANAIANYSYQP